MNMVSTSILLFLVSCAAAEQTNPIAKVIELLTSLEGKILKEGTAAQKVYDEFSEWCEDRSKNVGFEIKTGKAEVAGLRANIEQEANAITALSAKIEEISAAIAVDEADLKASTQIREQEAADFAAEKAELEEAIDCTDRAVGILQREMAKGGASMMQLKDSDSLAHILTILVDASGFSSADAHRLTALVQTAQASNENDEEDDVGAPDPATYKSHSGSVVETLEGLLDKAKTQLDAARAKETESLHVFELLKQSLEDGIKYGNVDMAAAKTDSSSSAAAKATAEGDLAVTSADLAEDVKTLGGLHQNCLTGAQDFEAATKSRGEELKALADAKKVLSENTGGAESVVYGSNQVSFLQMSRSSSDLINEKALRAVRDLARRHHAPELAQLASRMASAISLSTRTGEDPFVKVKGLLSEMIERLEQDADKDASHKAYCDKELAETHEKKDDKNTEIAKLSTQIKQMSAKSAQLKEEVSVLQEELAELAASQVAMTKLRGEEHDAFVSNKADLEQGLDGVKQALKVLREYYSAGEKGHTAAEGAGSTIIGLLEVVESDFSKDLAEKTATEESAAADYDRQSKENEITRTMKEQDVKYKTKEFTGLDKSVGEASSDRDGVQAELDAVMEYLGTLKAMCIEKAEPYAERKRRREAEIAGLKEALQILEGESIALLQQGTRRTLRGDFQ